MSGDGRARDRIRRGSYTRRMANIRRRVHRVRAASLTPALALAWSTALLVASSAHAESLNPVPELLQIELPDGWYALTKDEYAQYQEAGSSMVVVGAARSESGTPAVLFHQWRSTPTVAHLEDEAAGLQRFVDEGQHGLTSVRADLTDHSLRHTGLAPNGVAWLTESHLILSGGISVACYHEPTTAGSTACEAIIDSIRIAERFDFDPTRAIGSSDIHEGPSQLQVAAAMVIGGGIALLGCRLVAGWWRGRRRPD